jgi:glycosyltransferase involved in cell wall biosynthesis
MAKTTSILFLAPVLPIDVAAIGQILANANLLGRLVTRGTIEPGLAQILARVKATRTFARRPPSPVDRRRTNPVWIADLLYYTTLALTGSKTRATDTSFQFLDRYASRMVNTRVSGVLAREDCCARTFGRARERGVKTIYQLPTAYWRVVRKLMEAERAEFPGVCRAAERREDYQANRTEQKENELSLADSVICPSAFVRESLRECVDASREIKTIPFGAPSFALQDNRRRTKSLFLYVGNITMRKGVHRLLLAWRRLHAYRTCELRLIGEMFLTEEFLKDFRGMYTHLDRLPREKLRDHYREASAFVFNPLADGFGHVFAEAMACGTPVLCSRNSGAPDLVTDGAEGRLFDYGVDEQLSAVLEWALVNPGELALMGARAQQKASISGWEQFGQQFLPWIKSVTSGAA